MHTIEFDPGAFNPDAPWKVTTDDGSTWHARTDLSAAVQLTEYIYQRNKRGESPRKPEPPLPEGAVII